MNSGSESTPYSYTSPGRPNGWIVVVMWLRRFVHVRSARLIDRRTRGPSPSRTSDGTLKQRSRVQNMSK